MARWGLPLPLYTSNRRFIFLCVVLLYCVYTTSSSKLTKDNKIGGRSLAAKGGKVQAGRSLGGKKVQAGRSLAVKKPQAGRSLGGKKPQAGRSLAGKKPQAGRSLGGKKPQAGRSLKGPAGRSMKGRSMGNSMKYRSGEEGEEGEGEETAAEGAAGPPAVVSTKATPGKPILLTIPVQISLTPTGDGASGCPPTCAEESLIPPGCKGITKVTGDASKEADGDGILDVDKLESSESGNPAVEVPGDSSVANEARDEQMVAGDDGDGEAKAAKAETSDNDYETMEPRDDYAEPPDLMQGRSFGVKTKQAGRSMKGRSMGTSPQKGRSMGKGKGRSMGGGIKDKVKSNLDKIMNKVIPKGRSMGKGPQKGRSMGKEPQKGRSLAKGPQKGRSLGKGPQKGRSLGKGPQKGRSMGKEPQKGRSMGKEPQKGRSLGKGPQQKGRFLGGVKDKIKGVLGKFTGKKGKAPAAAAAPAADAAPAAEE